MLDSVFTLTKGGLAWLLGAAIACALLDRGLALVTRLPVTMFALFALVILAYVAVAGVYTLAKRMLRPRDAE